MQLFVMPVTANLLFSENYALDAEFKFAVQNRIPVLPLMQEEGLEEQFNIRCGELQFLSQNPADKTAVSYDEKLGRYLDSVLIGDELAEKAEDEEYTSLYGDSEYDEHLLGLTAELYYKYRDVSFDETESFKWLKENAHKFGFVLRYSNDKESITGVDYRPWTFRFVGRYNAVKMYQENLCLEEYVEKYLDR